MLEVSVDLVLLVGLPISRASWLVSNLGHKTCSERYLLCANQCSLFSIIFSVLDYQMNDMKRELDQLRWYLLF